MAHPINRYKAPPPGKEERRWRQGVVPQLQEGGKLEGKLNGPSHKEGGIKFNVGGEIQEAEGGEFVIKNDSVNPETEAVLEYINKTGDVPQYKGGGCIRTEDARKRSKNYA